MPVLGSTLGHFRLLVDLPGASEVSRSGVRVHCSDDTIRRATDGPQVHSILHVVFLQLGQDVLAIGVLAKSGDVGPDLGRKDRLRYAGLTSGMHPHSDTLHWFSKPELQSFCDLSDEKNSSSPWH